MVKAYFTAFSTVLRELRQISAKMANPTERPTENNTVKKVFNNNKKAIQKLQEASAMDFTVKKI